jgi:hypothetical protein
MNEDLQEIGGAVLVGVTVLAVLDRLVAAKPEVAGFLGLVATATVAAIAILLSRPTF